jgi:hypothetical protein
MTRQPRLPDIEPFSRDEVDPARSQDGAVASARAATSSRRSISGVSSRRCTGTRPSAPRATRSGTRSRSAAGEPPSRSRRAPRAPRGGKLADRAPQRRAPVARSTAKWERQAEHWSPFGGSHGVRRLRARAHGFRAELRPLAAHGGHAVDKHLVAPNVDDHVLELRTSPCERSSSNRHTPTSSLSAVARSTTCRRSARVQAVAQQAYGSTLVVGELLCWRGPAARTLRLRLRFEARADPLKRRGERALRQPTSRRRCRGAERRRRRASRRR